MLTTGGALTITDSDSPATFVAQTNAAGSNGYGTLSVDAAGVWTYSTTTPHDEFAGGTTYTDTLTVATADGTVQQLTVNLLGTNDAAVIAGINTSNIVETDAVLTTGGTLTITDIDSPEGGPIYMEYGAPTSSVISGNLFEHSYGVDIFSVGDGRSRATAR